MYSYANCLLASLNFRLVLRNQTDPTMTAIVWDDTASNTSVQSCQPLAGYQPPLVVQILAQVETNVDMGVNMNKVCRWIKILVVLWFMCSYRPVRQRIVLSKMKHVRFATDSFSEKHSLIVRKRMNFVTGQYRYKLGWSYTNVNRNLYQAMHAILANRGDERSV